MPIYMACGVSPFAVLNEFARALGFEETSEYMQALAEAPRAVRRRLVALAKKRGVKVPRIKIRWK